MTQKNKNKILLFGFLLALLICYQFAISKTIRLKKQVCTLKSQELLFKNLPKELSISKQKQQYFDSIFNQYELNGSSIQNNLLKIINNYANQNELKIVSFLEPHLEQKDDLTIKTYQLKLEGSYNNIIHLVYELEQKHKLGEIINVNFEKKKNFRSGREYIEASILLKSMG